MKLKERKNSSGSFSIFNPYVGGLGNVNMIALDVKPSKIICRQNQLTTIIFLVGFILFGPVLLLIAVANSKDLHDIPLYVAIPLLLLLVAANIGLLAGVIRQPKIILDKASGSISLFSNIGRGPKLLFRREEIDKFTTAQRTFHSSNGESYPNYTITLVPKSGKPLLLCCSPDDKLVEQFKEYLATYVGAPIVQGS